MMKKDWLCWRQLLEAYGGRHEADQQATVENRAHINRESYQSPPIDLRQSTLAGLGERSINTCQRCALPSERSLESDLSYFVLEPPCGCPLLSTVFLMLGILSLTGKCNMTLNCVFVRYTRHRYHDMDRRDMSSVPRKD